MAWHTHKIGFGNLSIKDGPLIVGSIMLKDDGIWHVRVFRFGASADITFEASEYMTALAFVSGVDKTFDALKDGP